MLPFALVLLSLIACIAAVRFTGLGLHQRFPLRRNLLALAVGMGAWVVLLVYGVLWQEAHAREVVTAWCADNRFALRSFAKCDAEGRRFSRRRIWEWEYHYRLDPIAEVPAKVLRIGNWFTGNLSDTATVVR